MDTYNLSAIAWVLGFAALLVLALNLNSMATSNWRIARNARGRRDYSSVWLFYGLAVICVAVAAWMFVRFWLLLAFGHP